MPASEKREKSTDPVREQDAPERSAEAKADVRVLAKKLDQDPRFNAPGPAVWKRAALIIAVIALFWLALTIRTRQSRRSRIIYADRYSNEHKYRPAASPIITEVLKDGRTRLRGVLPTGR